MRILGIRNVPGPNVYSHQPVLVMTLDLEDLAYRESYEVPGFVERLLGALPGVREHFCSLGRAGGFVERLKEGTWFGHIVEHVALELTDAVGISVNRGKTVETERPGEFLVAVTYRSEAGMRCLLEVAVDFVQALVDGRPFPLQERLKRARQIVEETSLGASTRAIVEAAERRNIPCTRLDEKSSLMRLGYGRKAKLIQATVTACTSAVGVDVASDKDLTKRLLGDAGVPVPRGRVVQTADEAVQAFAEIGLPVVVKPLDGNQGRGVSLNLSDADDVRNAFFVAQKHSRDVLVEQQMVGRDYRVLVVNYKLAAASRKTPANVVGDGVHTICELIDIANLDPKRGDFHEKPLSRIKVDDVVLALLERNGQTLDTVAARGETVYLRESANLSTGGQAFDVTHLVHPSTARMCERAARIVGLDVCGIDLVVPDISEAITGGGGVIEVNAAPGIRMHQEPGDGMPRDVAGAIVESLFPHGSDGRIPIISITGTNGKTTTTRLITHTLSALGERVGMTSTDAICIAGQEVVKGDLTGPWSARVVLGDPSVDVAVLETARGGIVRNGLGYDWSDVGIMTNIEADHIGQDGIRTVEDIVRIKQLVAERVREGGTLVVNADNEHLMRMLSDPRVSKISRNVVFFSVSEDNAMVKQQLAAGGSAYTRRGDWVEFHHGESARRIVRASAIPCTLNGTADFQIANVMCAIAACAALGHSFEDIASALVTFSNIDENFGRLNLYELGGAAFVVDYGHNAHAITAIGQMIRRWPAERRTAILGLPGDRAEEILISAAQAAGVGFERIVVREDVDLRGRQPGELAELVCHALADSNAGVQVEVILDELEAVRTVAGRVGPGDVAMAFSDRTTEVIELLRSLGAVPLASPDLLFDTQSRGMRLLA
jgi:cyanophycin synthetase